MPSTSSTRPARSPSTRRATASRRCATHFGAQVGFHAHNNLSLAVANTLAAIEEGATWIDSAARGFGAGAGNTATEVLAAVLDRLGKNPGLDVFKLMDIAEELVPPVMQKPTMIDRAALTLGYCGVYSSFLRHAERAAERFGVDTREILTEVGRRKAVGGQEDMIIEVAYELSQRRSPRQTNTEDR